MRALGLVIVCSMIVVPSALNSTSVVASASEPPVCDAGGPYSVWCGCTVDFDATGSSAPGGVITSYLWDFGDGATGEGAAPSHPYYIGWDWIFWAVLTVVDREGQARACTTRVSVTCDNIFPPLECDAGGPYSSEIGEEIRFDGWASTEESPNSLWDFGDGSTGSGLSTTHTYSTAGDYVVTLHVDDLLLFECYEIPREGSCETVAGIGTNAIAPTTWGAIKATFL